ncbi:probable RNA-binding protein CG14230 isoform X2 [Hyposmocoma kahamanoa]|uniref:probable RNA-binding protein CG14230 isoform X2 n=1 Tax=Hyposmocoma kahamanoa TaxID=1477025 RepID=UPI000E6D8FC5|nr:probable RNA-binding protein CG14230 isoform X2 [Hyposmocoma kahamanoa]
MNASEIRLFVGNIPEIANEQEVFAAFSTFGEIIKFDLKSRNEGENKKSFAFITLSASNKEVESCIKHFSSQSFKGTKLYVTRARESFLERLEREKQLQKVEKEQKQIEEHHSKKHGTLKLGEKLNPRKRRADTKAYEALEYKVKKNKKLLRSSPPDKKPELPMHRIQRIEDSDKKRLESLKRKRLEYMEQQLIIKSGLGGIDKVHNKKIVFSDNEASPTKKKFLLDHSAHKTKGKTLFDDDDSGDELNFNIKKHYEGKKGQKVLDLQSRYKSDKRFVLDEKFIEDEAEEDCDGVENIVDEKTRQLNILQNVLGVAVKTSTNKDADNKKLKTKIGMLRFDPLQPEHAKFLAPADELQEQAKKSKKKKSKDKQQEDEQPKETKTEGPKVEVSKEQFYNISETLKEAIKKPASFSLRSLFRNNEEENKEEEETTTMDYIPLTKPKDDYKKFNNPLDPGQRNPFVYDSSDSENEENNEINKDQLELTPVATKAVWKENLFFSKTDQRLEGLTFFNKINANEVQKERRELKSLMKKRIYNKERKNQMFHKKIGGRRKTMKKSYRKKS